MAVRENVRIKSIIRIIASMNGNVYVAVFPMICNQVRYQQAYQIKTHPRGGFLFGYMMEDSNRGSYTRRKQRTRHFFLVYFVKRNAVSCQAPTSPRTSNHSRRFFIFHMYLKTSLRSRRFFDCSFSGKQCAAHGKRDPVSVPQKGVSSYVT